MKRWLGAAALALAFCVVSQAPAQPPAKGGETVKQLEADLQKLRDQMKEVEAKLAKAREAEKKQASRRGRGFEGFKGKGPFGKGPRGFQRGPGKGSPKGPWGKESSSKQKQTP